jgi:glycosyltransferase involved in cell wall biosynthesis
MKIPEVCGDCCKNKEDFLISIVIPVYRGENTIGKLVQSLISEIKSKYNFEIVLINDNSPDNSSAICKELQKKYSDIISFYSLAKNVGEHNAVMAGLNKAMGDYVIIMDDDLQNPISEIEKLITAVLTTGNDVIYTFYDKKKQSFWRNIGSWINDKAANIMLKKPSDLYLSSFKIMNRFVINEIVKYDLPFPYIDGLILRITDKIGKIRVEHHEREIGESGYTLKKLVLLWLNMFTNFSILPLRMATYLGFIFAGFGLMYGLFTIIEKIVNPELPLGWPTLTVSITIFAGVELLAIGMIGEYIGRIFISINKQPQFTIRECCEAKRNSDGNE